MPDVLETLNTALAHHQRGEWDSAQALCRQVLALAPRQPEAWHLLGFMALQRGDGASALAPLQQAIALAPDVAEPHANLGLAQRALGDLGAAHASLLQAHRLAPTVAEHCNTLGAVCAELGRTDQAIEWYQRAIALQPDHVAAHTNLGQAWLACGRAADALGCFESVSRSQPAHPEIDVMLGFALAQLDRHDEAMAAYQRALARHPEDALAMSHLASTLTRLGKAGDAIALARRALSIRPGLAAAWSSLGTPLQHGGKVAEAEAAFREALVLDGKRQVDHFNLSLSLLLQGRFEAGWAAYESRFRLPHYRALGPAARCPPWQGEALRGRSVLVVAEQGLGDVIQFSRYVRLLQERGAAVTVHCQQPLLRLLQTLPGAPRCVDVEQPPPDTDFALPVMSLPHRLGTRLDTIPAAVPYLHAAMPSMLAWRRRLARWQDGPRVGLVWQGRPTHGADRYRSLPLARLDPLAEVPGVHFVSLQHEASAGPAEPAGRMAQRLVDLGQAPTDLADLAALIANLDLVISVDTAVCHLAGAMARPVWVLLHTGPDFRWLLGRDDSPWYPSARLFRQSRLGDWEGVVERVREALQVWCGGGRGT
jgi:Flp pilus assembly protein TadD